MPGGSHGRLGQRSHQRRHGCPRRGPTGYQLSWVALLVAPMLGVVLAIAAQVGIVARSDLQSLVVKHYGQRVARALLASIVLVNLVTIAADLQAGAVGSGCSRARGPTGSCSRWAWPWSACC